MSKLAFSEVMNLGDNYEVYDFTQGSYDELCPWRRPMVGKYDELRPGMYLGEQFTGDQRDLHIGIDLAGPAGTSSPCVFGGCIFMLGDNALSYDYGPTIITCHTWNGQTLYALHGHLARESLKRWRQGDVFEAGGRTCHLGR